MTDITPAEVSSSVNQALPQSDTPAISETTTELPSEPMPTQSDIEASTATITAAPVQTTSVTEPKPEPTQPQIQDEAPEAADTLLLPERVSPPSPVKESLEIDIATNDEVLVLSSNVEKSD